MEMLTVEANPTVPVFSPCLTFLFTHSVIAETSLRHFHRRNEPRPAGWWNGQYASDYNGFDRQPVLYAFIRK